MTWKTAFPKLVKLFKLKIENENIDQHIPSTEGRNILRQLEHLFVKVHFLTPPIFRPLSGGLTPGIPYCPQKAQLLVKVPLIIIGWLA